MKSFRIPTVIFISSILILFINHQNFSQIKLVNGVYYLEDQKFPDTTGINRSSVLEKESDLPLSIIKNEFKVNNECGEYGSNQLYPDIAKGKGGDYILVWVDERTGAQEILAQIYNLLGEKVFGLIEVSDGTTVWNVAPNVIYNKVTEEYLITWARDSKSIVLQRLDRNGNKIGNNITINDKFFCNTNNPSVAVDNHGNIMLTWYSESIDCNSSSIIFVKLFDKDMNPLSYQRTFVDENKISSIGRDCRIASDTLDNFVVVWSSFDNGQSKIFLQKINTYQWTFEENILVSQTSSGVFPTITGNADGNFLITWTEENKGLAARLYNVDSGFITDQFYIVQNNYYAYQHSSSSDENGNFYVTSGNWNPIIHKLNKNGEIIDSTQINNLLLKPYNSPKLSEVTYNRFYYAIYGNNHEDIDIQIGIMDSNLTPLIPDNLYEEDECSSPERRPKIKFNKDGSSIVLWESGKDGARSIYGQIYNKDFEPSSKEFLVSDSSKYKLTYDTKVNTDNNGNYLVSFSNGYNNETNVFQKISANGQKLGGNIELSKNNSNPNIYSNTDKNNNTMFCWHNVIGNLNNKVYYQQFDSNLTPLHEVKFISLESEYNYGIVKDIYIDSDLNILIMWNDYDVVNDKSGNDLKAKLFNKNGDDISGTIIVYTGVENTWYIKGKCMMDENGNYIFAFSKKLIGGNNYPSLFVLRKYLSLNKTYLDSVSLNSYFQDIQIVKFQNKKTFITYNYANRISGYYFDDVKRKSTYVELQYLTPFYYNSFDLANNYSCDIYKDNLFLVYELVKEKNRSFDIYANVQDFSDIYSEINKPDDDYEFSIYGLYPNPSNTNVTLEYTVPKLSCIKLIIYNSIGQIVKIIDQGVQFPGLYYFDFSVADFSTGVYFIKELNSNSLTKKFIVIK